MTEYSGRTTLHKHKFNNWADNPVTAEDQPAIRKVTFFDVQWSTCPIEVEGQVKGLWRSYELGNDRYMLKLSINDLEEIHSNDYPTDLIAQYLRENNIPENETVIIHWWW